MAITEAYDYGTGHETAISHLKGHLCIWRENLYITYAFGLSCGCEVKPKLGYRCMKHDGATLLLCARKVGSMTPYPDIESVQDKNHANLLYDMGHVNYALKALSFFREALKHDDLMQEYPILCQLVRPCEPFAPRKLRDDDAKAEASCFQSQAAEEDACPLNKKLDTELCKEQKQVVENLHRGIEIIQGPPGTGKSTLIRSIARKHIPWQNDDVTLILAVQNKAIDVLVEGFAPFVDDHPSKSRMFVLGSPANPSMGASAAGYTLDSLLSKNLDYAQALAGMTDKYASMIIHRPACVCVAFECLFFCVFVCPRANRLQGCCSVC